MGDLVATCTSDKSRNRTVGVALGQGRALEEIVAEMKMVAEGVKTTEAVLELAGRRGVEMPIAEQVGAVLYEGRKPEEIVPALMLREAKPELRGMRR
jgi:glycerol-3-phosphate dehydrogenase (NAD(P)+)